MTAANAPLVVVSIVHWNGGEATLACIESVWSDGYPNVSIVVVDNASSDRISDTIESRWPAITVIRSATNSGFSGGHNLGIRAALDRGAAYVLLLNQDALLVTGCIPRMVALAESEPRTGLVCPLVRYIDQPSRIQFAGSWLDRRDMCIVYDGDLEVVRARDADPATTMCLWGTALLIRREVVEQVGVLDDRLFAYFEDTDYSVRSSAAGWRNRMCFDAAILHEGHPTRFTRAPNFFYYTARNEMLFWRSVFGGKRSGRIRRVCVARTLREAAQMRDAGLPAQVDASVLGLVDAFRGRSGPFDPARRAPRWLSRLLLSHPYLLADLLDGHLFASMRRGASGAT